MTNILWMLNNIRQRMTLIGWSTTSSSVIGCWVWGMTVIGCRNISRHMTGWCFIGLCKWTMAVIRRPCSLPTQLNLQFFVLFNNRAILHCYHWSSNIFLQELSEIAKMGFLWAQSAAYYPNELGQSSESKASTLNHEDNSLQSSFGWLVGWLGD